MKYLITGITGSLGTKVCEFLLKTPGNEVVGYSRDEFKQSELVEKIKDKRLLLYLGDIRSSERFTESCRGVDTIFHFAALKQVDKLESNPEEAIFTNILGTLNVLHAQRTHSIKRVVLSSTDKAAFPINVYGASKLIAERLVLRNTNNVVCRYGNVLASRGSVVEKIVKRLVKDGKAPITNSNMTRFWISIEEAAEFITRQGLGPTGGLKIPSMKACPIHTLVTVIASCMQLKSYEMEHIGTRPGEKIDECLRTEYEGDATYSNHAPRFTDFELGSLLSPIVEEIVKK